ncbi:MAG: hypothetical protein WC839_03605 [Candidatus Paceibacterota bacterium]
MEIDFLKKKKKFKKESFRVKPDFYWRRILYVWVVLILASCVFGFYFFMKMNRELVLPVISTGEQNAIKKERFNSILEYFKEREKKSIEILNSPSPIVDPSL